MSNIGSIGLGTMGVPMAGYLRAGGHRLFVRTRSGVPEALVGAGASVCVDMTPIDRALDHSAMLRTLERLAHVEVGQKP